MQESLAVQSYEIRKFIGIIIPILLLGCVAIATPFAVLKSNEPPPYNPPPPGWETSKTIYLWGFRGSIAPPLFSPAWPFVFMTLLYLVIHILVGMRKLPAKHSTAIDVVLILIWVTVCHMIYGTLQDWSLIQVPIIPIVGMILLLVVYGNQAFQLSPTTPASSSYLSS